MLSRIEDEAVEAIRMSPPEADKGFLVAVNFGDLKDAEQRIVGNFLYMSDWRDVRALAEAAAAQRSYALDIRGIVYPDPDAEEPDEFTDFEGVNVWFGSDAPVNMSARAFDRMMSRLLMAVIDGAARSNDQATAHPWWDALVEHAQAIADRARSRGAPETGPLPPER